MGFVVGHVTSTSNHHYSRTRPLYSYVLGHPNTVFGNSHITTATGNVTISRGVLGVHGFQPSTIRPRSLVTLNAFSRHVLRFVRTVMLNQVGIIVTNNANSNGAALLGTYSSFVPSGRHVIAVRSTPRLHLRGPRIIHGATHQPGVRNRNRVAVQRLIVRTLHRHPSQVIINRYHNNRTFSVVRTVVAKRRNSLAAIRSSGTHRTVAHLHSVVRRAKARVQDRRVVRLVTSTVSFIVFIGHCSVSNSQGVARVTRIRNVRNSIVAVNAVVHFRRANFSRSNGILKRFVPAKRHVAPTRHRGLFTHNICVSSSF